MAWGRSHSADLHKWVPVSWHLRVWITLYSSRAPDISQATGARKGVCCSHPPVDVNLYTTMGANSGPPLEVIALRRRRECQYFAFNEAHMGLQGRAFQANIFIEDMVFLGDTRSAEELAVFTNMAPERLCLGCGLRVEENFTPIFPGERGPLFAASVKLLQFALRASSASATDKGLTEDEGALFHQSRHKSRCQKLMASASWAGEWQLLFLARAAVQPGNSRIFWFLETGPKCNRVNNRLGIFLGGQLEGDTATTTGPHLKTWEIFRDLCTKVREEEQIISPPSSCIQQDVSMRERPCYQSHPDLGMALGALQEYPTAPLVFWSPHGVSCGCISVPRPSCA